MSSPHGPSPTLHGPSPTPKAVSNPIFDKALEQHRQRLQDWELVDFAASSPEGVLDVANEYHSTHAKKSRLLRCVQRISRVIAPLEKFFSAVDNGVSSHPEIAGIVWGALRFVMQAIRSLSAYFEKIGDMLEDIAEDLQYYQEYATTLYAKSERVMKVVLEFGDDASLMTNTME